MDLKGYSCELRDLVLFTYGPRGKMGADVPVGEGGRKVTNSK